MGDVSAGRCWSVDTGWVRLNEIPLWAGKTPKKEKWRYLPPQSVCLPLVFSYFPVLSKHTVRLQRGDNQLWANAYGKGTRQECLEKCPSTRLAPTLAMASPPRRHRLERQRLVQSSDFCEVQICREWWTGLQVGAQRRRAQQHQCAGNNRQVSWETQMKPHCPT